MRTEQKEQLSCMIQVGIHGTQEQDHYKAYEPRKTGKREWKDDKLGTQHQRLRWV